MCVSPRNLLIQAALTMIVMPTWCGTTTDPHNNIQSIIYSVLIHGVFIKMMVNDSHGVQEHPNIPPSYKGRVKIEGTATLVIKNINPGDNTEFRCELIGRFVYTVESRLQLIVAGTYYRHNHK